MNKIYITFSSIEDARYAEEALAQKVLFCPGASLMELTIKPADRFLAREILDNCGISYIMH